MWMGGCRPVKSPCMAGRLPVLIIFLLVLKMSSRNQLPIFNCSCDILFEFCVIYLKSFPIYVFNYPVIMFESIHFVKILHRMF